MYTLEQIKEKLQGRFASQLQKDGVLLFDIFQSAIHEEDNYQKSAKIAFIKEWLTKNTSVNFSAVHAEILIGSQKDCPTISALIDTANQYFQLTDEQKAILKRHKIEYKDTQASTADWILSNLQGFDLNNSQTKYWITSMGGEVSDFFDN